MENLWNMLLIKKKKQTNKNILLRVKMVEFNHHLHLGDVIKIISNICIHEKNIKLTSSNYG